ncbi:MAG TPA: sugar phosphate isomerase/epimerase [Tepidisphaeraceae bacterium]|nr:sugar phosphate isomerase/epimerase [Tepidisphaeraceae bacterium]
MLRLCGFADEIGPSIDEQISVCKKVGVTDFELRGVAGKNVLAFDEGLKSEIKEKLNDAGLGVACIGSPCGKKAIDTPRAELLDMFKIALSMAQFFNAKLIRVFSFYPEGGEGKGPIEPVRERSIELLQAQCELLNGTDITMVHENERGIFGDTGARCLDLMKSVNHSKFRAAYDFANFVQVGEDNLKTWPMLKPFTTHIHVKDAIRSTGEVVPAGEGDGQLGPIIADAYKSGYRGFLSLEPHLKVAGHSHGESGAELFAVAVQSLREVCKQHGVPLAS